MNVDPNAETLHAPAALVAGRYEILGLLGAGAMGTVYRARDRELDEVVAIKVLKKELATAEMLERFRREVKLARRVTHANVARTFDIGESGGDRFLTMELVDGEMLASLLARKRRLSASETVKLGLDVCAGLAAAHAANVLHRDLNPENVIVAKDGRAVITDFGIARAVVDDATRTSAGIVGTPAYMAPEQVEGKDLDARADLYALGTMLFELLTGELAWTGESILSIATSRLFRPPPDVRAQLPGAPPALAEVVLKLMAREREDRFGGADETANALRTALAATTPERASTVPVVGTLRLPRTSRGGRAVAVLPPASSTAEDAYLVDGLHEDIVDLLSVVPGLAVRPRGDTFRFRDVDRDVRAIGHDLGADVIVDGSFRRIDGTVRASFRLIAVEDDLQLWARRFDRPAAQLLAIADEAAEAIAHALTTELQPRGRVIPASPEAEDLFLRGRWYLRRAWNDSAADAVALLERAHRLEPGDRRIAASYALASARAFGLQRMGTAGGESTQALAREILAADPLQVDARCALGVLCFNRQEGEQALRHFREALALAPNAVDALEWAGRLLGEVGLVEEGIAFLRRAAAVDPDSVMPLQQIARLRLILGDGDAMRALLGPMPEPVGDLAAWTIMLGREALWCGDSATGRLLRERVGTRELPAEVRFQLESYLGAVAGNGAHLMADRDFVERMLPTGPSAGPRRASFHAQLQAELYASIGWETEALAALADADANGLHDIVWLDRCPLLDPLRNALGGIRGRVAARAERVIRVYRSG